MKSNKLFKINQSKWLYYRKKLFALVYLLGFVLAVVGSWQVYRPMFDDSFKFVSTFIFSVGKLFLFSPTVSVEKQAPLAYELARWIAPAGTVLGFLSIFEPFFFSLRLWATHLRRPHLAVLGNGEDALGFMKAALDERRDERLMCILPETATLEERRRLEKMNIRVVLLDYSRAGCFSNLKAAKAARFDKLVALVSFELEPQNFGHLQLMNDLLDAAVVMKSGRRLTTHVAVADNSLKSLVQAQMEQCLHLDLHYFNLLDLTALKLTTEDGFHIERNHGLQSPWQESDLRDFSAISAKLGRAHLLLVGFGALGQHILMQAVNQGTINCTQNMKLTLVDRKVKQLYERLSGDLDQLTQVCDLELLELDVLSRQARRQLSELCDQEPVSSVVFALNDSQLSLLAAERFSDHWPSAQVAVYCPQPEEFKPLITALQNKHPKLILFGEKSGILTRAVIMREQLFRKAKDFNAYYNRTAAQLMGWPLDGRSADEQWEALDSFKKESSLYQAMHAPIKVAILRRAAELAATPLTVEALIASFRQKLDGLSVREQVDVIHVDPLMNYLTALEHKRWNNFHYMRGFRYATVKNPALKEHDCLIDDWEEFLSLQYDKAIYDFLSVLSLG